MKGVAWVQSRVGRSPKILEFLICNILEQTIWHDPMVRQVMDLVPSHQWRDTNSKLLRIDPSSVHCTTTTWYFFRNRKALDLIQDSGRMELDGISMYKCGSSIPFGSQLLQKLRWSELERMSGANYGLAEVPATMGSKNEMHMIANVCNFGIIRMVFELEGKQFYIIHIILQTKLSRLQLPSPEHLIPADATNAEQHLDQIPNSSGFQGFLRISQDHTEENGGFAPGICEDFPSSPAPPKRLHSRELSRSPQISTVDSVNCNPTEFTESMYWHKYCPVSQRRRSASRPWSAQLQTTSLRSTYQWSRPGG